MSETPFVSVLVLHNYTINSASSSGDHALKRTEQEEGKQGHCGCFSNAKGTYLTLTHPFLTNLQSLQMVICHLTFAHECEDISSLY